MKSLKMTAGFVLVSLALGSACAASDDDDSVGATTLEVSAPETDEKSSSAASSTVESSESSDTTVTETSDSATSQSETTETEDSTNDTKDSSGNQFKTVELDHFKTPSENIVCRLYKESADCVISNYSYDGQEDKPDCNNDWENYLTIGKSGKGSFGCISDATFYMRGEEFLNNEDFPATEYGQKIVSNGFSCLVEKTGITCTNEAQNGFKISRANYEFF